MIKRHGRWVSVRYILAAAFAIRASGQIILTISLPPASVGNMYRYQIGASGLSADDPVTFSVAGERGAEWLNVTPSGLLEGSPDNTAPESSSITVLARSGPAQVATRFLVPVIRAEVHLSCPPVGPGYRVLPKGTSHVEYHPEYLFHDESMVTGRDEHLQCVQVIQFNRVLWQVGEVNYPNGVFGHLENRAFQWNQDPRNVAPELVAAVNGSKIPISGSILVAHDVADCRRREWKIVTESTDSSNILVYGSSEVSVYCRQTTDRESDLLIVLPVHAIWANVFENPADTTDPSWRPISDVPSQHNCYGELNTPADGIRPCDTKQVGRKGPNVVAKVFDWAPVAWIYNRVTQPGVSQGSFSFAPVDIAPKSTWDAQGYFSTRSAALGGWIGLSTMLEHDIKMQDDLNSFTAALTYNWRWGDNQNFWLSGGETGTIAPIVGLRVPEFTLKVGPEFAPGPPGISPPPVGLPGTGATTSKRDLNLVGGATARLPVIFNFLKQPSIISVLPIGGFEWGGRVDSHQIVEFPSQKTETVLNQPQHISRLVTGVDGSLRWPFQLSHNFLGDKPITVDYSYRLRWLFDAEPFVDESWPKPYETLSAGWRSYTRITLLMPLSAYLQLRGSWQHGTLPPEFQYAGNVFTLGLAFSNPGSVEH